MTRAKLVSLLKENRVQEWNQWRENNYASFVELQDVNLSNLDLREVNFRHTLLNNTNLQGTDLRGADFEGTSLGNADFRNADLRNVTFDKRNWSGRMGADLRGANLSGADLKSSQLHNVKLRGAKLIGADLRSVDLRGLDLSDTDLRDSNLRHVRALGTNFTGAVFTGACLEDWNINTSTTLDGAICEYVYLEANQQERRPHGGSFLHGEFTQRFQKFLETVDLFFVDGVDWKAFLTSFQDLQSQYGDENLAVQGIERKGQSSFEIRLAVPSEADKAEIERVAYECYEADRQLRDAQHREQIAAKEGEITRYRQQADSLKDELLDVYRQQSQQSSPDLMEVVKILAARDSVVNVEATAVAEKVNNSQIFNAPVGNAAVNNHGTMSTIQNNYDSKAEDITRLLTALRDQAQTFSTDQKDEANDTLDLLERDLKEEQPDQGRISRRLKRLFALGAAIGTIASGAAAVSGDVSTFTGNVIELTEQLGIPVEQVQLPPSGTS